ncbi:hypothetical protein F5883DRAFT_652724 [Diaporthe sp. PMI_573]|nr:hypothetical protein F5883DRAFT_652724 [Diaporthaceae sp. PMI_573]
MKGNGCRVRRQSDSGGEEDPFDYHPEQFQNFDPCAAGCDPTPARFGPSTSTNRYRVGHNGQWIIHGGVDIAAAAMVKPFPVVKLRQSTTPEPLSNPDSGHKGSPTAEKDDLTLSQSRRRAQNRAAQRAFRKRKAQHVKDFEAKLASLEAAQRELASENERLQRDLQEMSLENAMLKATPLTKGGHLPCHDGAPVTTWPLQYISLRFCTNFLSPHANETSGHRNITSDNGEWPYAAGAT